MLIALVVFENVPLHLDETIPVVKQLTLKVDIMRNFSDGYCHAHDRITESLIGTPERG